MAASTLAPCPPERRSAAAGRRSRTPACAPARGHCGPQRQLEVIRDRHIDRAVWASQCSAVLNDPHRCIHIAISAGPRTRPRYSGNAARRDPRMPGFARHVIPHGRRRQAPMARNPGLIRINVGCPIIIIEHRSPAIDFIIIRQSHSH